MFCVDAPFPNKPEPVRERLIVTPATALPKRSTTLAVTTGPETVAESTRASVAALTKFW